MIQRIKLYIVGAEYMKKLKLPLEMTNGQQVRSLQELRNNWDLEKVLGYYLNGRLLNWLNDRYYLEEAEKIQQLEELKDTKDLLQRLCAVFGVQYQNSDLINVEAIEKRNQKLERLRLYTADDVILKNVDKIAFDQNELEYLLAHGSNIIYLCSGEFNIEKNKENIVYIGIDNPTVKMNRETWHLLRKNNCIFNNCKLDVEKGNILSVEKRKNFLLKKEISVYSESRIFIYENYLIAYIVDAYGGEVYVYDLGSERIIYTAGDIKPTPKSKCSRIYLDNCLQYENYLVLHWNSNDGANRCLQTFDLNTLTEGFINYYNIKDNNLVYHPEIKYMHIYNGNLFVNATEMFALPLGVERVYSLPNLIEKQNFTWEVRTSVYCGGHNDATGYYEDVVLNNEYIYAFLSEFKKIFSNNPKHKEITLKKGGKRGSIGFFRIINNNIFAAASTSNTYKQGFLKSYNKVKPDSILEINEIGIFDIEGGEIKKIIKDPTFTENDKFDVTQAWTDIKYAAGMYWINSLHQKFYALDEDTFEVLREFDAGMADGENWICDVVVDEERNRIFVLRANGIIDIFE